MTADSYVPSREDHFSFGIWTVGWQGVDVFGGPVRPPMAADRAVRKLAELGAYGVTSGSPRSGRRLTRPGWW
jgi:xylose isomerase